MSEAVYGIIIAVILFLAAYGISGMGDFKINRILYTNSGKASEELKKKYKTLQNMLKVICFVYVLFVLLLNSIISVSYDMKLLVSGIFMVLLLIPLWILSSIKMEVAAENEYPDIIIKEKLMRIIYIIIAVIFLVVIILGVSG